MSNSFGLITGNLLGGLKPTHSTPIFRMPRPGAGGQPKLVRPFVVKITAHRLFRLPP